MTSKNIIENEFSSLPSPTFAGAELLRYLPELGQGRHDHPAVHEPVQLQSRDVSISPVWKGKALLSIHDHPNYEFFDLKSISVRSGYTFPVALTVDDLVHLSYYNLNFRLSYLWINNKLPKQRSN